MFNNIKNIEQYLLNFGFEKIFVINNIGFLKKISFEKLFLTLFISGSGIKRNAHVKILEEQVLHYVKQYTVHTCTQYIVQQKIVQSVLEKGSVMYYLIRYFKKRPVAGREQ